VSARNVSVRREESVIWVYVHCFAETTTDLGFEDVVMEPEIASELRLHRLGRPRVQLYVLFHSNPFSRLQGNDRILAFCRAIQSNPPETERLFGASAREADFESKAEIREGLRFRRWLKVTQMRPGWDIDQSESRIEKPKLCFKCIQSDVCWRTRSSATPNARWSRGSGAPSATLLPPIPPPTHGSPGMQWDGAGGNRSSVRWLTVNRSTTLTS
jgi:hypothetical protein